MNNHEFERKMNFIVEQQAQFASDIQRLGESQARTEQVLARTVIVVEQTAGIVERSTDVVGRVTEALTSFITETKNGFKEVDAKIDALVNAQIRNEEMVSRLGENLARNEARVVRTEENVARTDESLRNLIDTVNRQVNKDRNGSGSE